MLLFFTYYLQSLNIYLVHNKKNVKVIKNIFLNFKLLFFLQEKKTFKIFAL